MRQLNEKLFKNTKLIKILKQKANVLDMILKQFPHVSNETVSDYVTLNNTAKAPMTIETIPQTSQETTTGKNILNATQQSYTLPATSTIYQRIYDTKPFLEAGRTYYISYDIENNSSSNTRSTPRIYLDSSNYYYDAHTNNNLLSGRHVDIYTPTTSGEYEVQYWLQGSNVAVTISNFMISTNNDTTYEPYTGLISAPNPDYPQDIHCTTGENQVKVVRKNLFDKNTIINET